MGKRPRPCPPTVACRLLHGETGVPPPPPAPPPPPPVPPPPPPAPPPPPPAPPPPPPPPPTRHLPFASPSAPLPPSLARLGNDRAWKEARRHLATARHRPLVVHGPVGCGKTVGAHTLLAALGYRVAALDGADADTGKELVDWVRLWRRTEGTDGVRCAVVLDDFESFTPDTRAALVALFKQDDPRLLPVVITCRNVRDPAMAKGLEGLAAVRLFAPCEHTCREWFTTHHVWEAPLADGTVEKRQGMPQAVVRAANDAVVSGDLRRCAREMAWLARFRKRDPGVPDRFVESTFEATRRLLKRVAPAEEWARRAGPWDVHLLQHHLPSHVGEDDCDGLAHAYDALSMADLAPERFETRDAHTPFAAHTAALAARITSRARDVRALVPPPRVGGEERTHRTPWSERDIPALLRDRSRPGDGRRVRATP